MKLSAHQPIYLGGYLGHFAKMAWCDQWIVFDVCPMEDSGFENRQRILGPNGVQMLTVPIHRTRETRLDDVRVAGNSSWQRKHWRSIELAYQRAPHWGLYSGGLYTLLTRRWESLADLDIALLRFFMEALGLSVPIRRASDMGLKGSKSDLVLDMVLKAGATEYLFGPLGREYADVPAFERAGVRVHFQEYQHPTYPQMKPGFVPSLSVLDLLMNVGPDSLKVLRGEAK